MRPTSEIARVIDSVARGDLSQRMALEMDGVPLRGEFLRIGNVVNAMVDQLTVSRPKCREWRARWVPTASSAVRPWCPVSRAPGRIPPTT